MDEATADIDKAQKLDPKNSDAFALQSMIAVTQNEKGKALDLARKAVESDPKSATARIALSYAQQAHFDLRGALGSLEEAVKLAPGNALAWARLAELRQSFGYLDKSLDAAKKAVALNPDLSRTQTVLGFSHLTRVETKKAKGAFEKAIQLDDADPLPRLGLGLAKIREGNLEEGRREIEIAMSLDPNNSLIRSYLGKAYYEEKRDKLATGQYEMAKSLDPSDPTPYFYDAIEKQTTNRPVEALQRHGKGHRVERQPGGLPFAPAARRGPRGAEREPRPDLQRPGLPAARAGGGVEIASITIRPTIPPTGSWPTPTPRCLATRSRGSVNCFSPSCCSRSTSLRSSPVSRRAICSPCRQADPPTFPSTSSTPCSTGTGSRCRRAASWGRTARQARKVVVGGLYNKVSASLGAVPFPDGWVPGQRRSEG